MNPLSNLLSPFSIRRLLHMIVCCISASLLHRSLIVSFLSSLRPSMLSLFYFSLSFCLELVPSGEELAESSCRNSALSIKIRCLQTQALSLSASPSCPSCFSLFRAFSLPLSLVQNGVELCRKFMPQLRSLYQKIKQDAIAAGARANAFEIVFVSQDQTPVSRA